MVIATRHVPERSFRVAISSQKEKKGLRCGLPLFSLDFEVISKKKVFDAKRHYFLRILRSSPKKRSLHLQASMIYDI